MSRTSAKPSGKCPSGPFDVTLALGVVVVRWRNDLECMAA
jgi:hypothetical protein